MTSTYTGVLRRVEAEDTEQCVDSGRLRKQLTPRVLQLSCQISKYKADSQHEVLHITTAELFTTCVHSLFHCAAFAVNINVMSTGDENICKAHFLSLPLAPISVDCHL